MSDTYEFYLYTGWRKAYLLSYLYAFVQKYFAKLQFLLV